MRATVRDRMLPCVIVLSGIILAMIGYYVLHYIFNDDTYVPKLDQLD